MTQIESCSDNLSEQIGKKPVVFFDVDNTLVDGFSILFFANYLAKRGLLATSRLAAMNKDLQDFPVHKDYKKFADDVVQNYSEGLRGLPKTAVEKAGRQFAPKYMRHLYPYSSELTNLMNNHGYTIAVSGAPKEAFEPIAQRLGICETHLLEAEVVDGYYTGKIGVNMALNSEKIKAVKQVRARGLNMANSYAFGDSIHDLPILQAASYPFVVGNRDSQLAELALVNNWAQVDSENILQTVKGTLG